MSGAPLTGTDKLWSDLTLLEPAEVCSRTLSSFNDGSYSVLFMGGNYLVDQSSQSITGPEQHPDLGGGLELLLLAYLVDGKDLELEGKWISEKEVPGGSLFFTGPHKMPLAPIAVKYGTRPAELIVRAKSLGGTDLEFGDASVAFNALPRIPVAFVLWEQDDEFPAEATVMFDATVHQHIPVDVILGLVDSVVKFLL